MSQDWVRFEGGEGARVQPEPGRSVVGVLANLSGDAPRPTPAGFRAVDRDDIDGLLAETAPQLELELPLASLQFTSWDDFRPEGIVARTPSLSVLLAARDRIGDPDVLPRLESAGALTPREQPVAPPPAPESGATLLDEILGADANESAAPAPPVSADPVFDRLIREIAEASAVRTDYTALSRWQEAIDAELQRRLRALLGQPRFRALESAWRSLRDLVRHAETGESLRVQVLDMAWESLAAAGAGASDALTALLTNPPAGEPFSLLVADARFGLGDADLVLLSQLGAAAAAAPVGLVAAARPELLRAAASGELEADERWSAVRASAWASRVALVGPAPLARLPYAPDADAVEGFDFDEGASAASPERYCFGNGAFLLARAALDALAQGSPTSEALRFGRFDDLPVHVQRSGREAQVVGPTRPLLSDAECARVVEAGLIPLASDRSGAFCQLLSLATLARPASSVLG